MDHLKTVFCLIHLNQFLEKECFFTAPYVLYVYSVFKCTHQGTTSEQLQGLPILTLYIYCWSKNTNSYDLLNLMMNDDDDGNESNDKLQK